MPAQLTASGVFATPKFETQPETMKRALTWLQATGNAQNKFHVITLNLLTYDFMMVLGIFNKF